MESGAGETLELILEGVRDLGERDVGVTELASLCKLLLFFPLVIQTLAGSFSTLNSIKRTCVFGCRHIRDVQ